MSPRDVSLCAYPWDAVGDPAAADRAANTGATGVALAAAYHSVRAATPFHPQHRVVDAAHAAAYFPVQDNAWRGKRLIPFNPSGWASSSAYSDAKEAFRKAGLRVEPWVVLTHSSVLGSANPDLCVTNAFGDVYPYALCPSSQHVLEYAMTLVSECARLTGPQTMMIEACGPLGFSHLGHHEKTQGADWSPTDETLLSICFCAACVTAYEARGLDADELRVTIRTSIGGGVDSIDEALADSAAHVLAARRAAQEALATAVAEAARSEGVASLTFHTQLDPWASGPFASAHGVGCHADSHIMPGPILESLLHDPGKLDSQLRNLQSLSRSNRVGGYLNALPPATIDSIEPVWATLAGYLDDVYVYHFGLLSNKRLASVTSAISAMADA